MDEREVVVLGATDVGGDVLLVRGTIAGVVDDEGRLAQLVATGWVSATTNHFDATSYEDVADERAQPDATGARFPGRHLKADAQPRAMRAEELRAYCRDLLLAQHPPQRELLDEDGRAED